MNDWGRNMAGSYGWDGGTAAPLTIVVFGTARNLRPGRAAGRGVGAIPGAGGSAAEGNRAPDAADGNSGWGSTKGARAGFASGGLCHTTRTAGGKRGGGWGRAPTGQGWAG